MGSYEVPLQEPRVCAIPERKPLEVSLGCRIRDVSENPPVFSALTFPSEPLGVFPASERERNPWRIGGDELWQQIAEMQNSIASLVERGTPTRVSSDLAMCGATEPSSWIGCPQQNFARQNFTRLPCPMAAATSAQLQCPKFGANGAEGRPYEPESMPSRAALVCQNPQASQKAEYRCMDDAHVVSSAHGFAGRPHEPESMPPRTAFVYQHPQASQKAEYRCMDGAHVASPAHGFAGTLTNASVSDSPLLLACAPKAVEAARLEAKTYAVQSGGCGALPSWYTKGLALLAELEACPWGRGADVVANGCPISAGSRSQEAHPMSRVDELTPMVQFPTATVFTDVRSNGSRMEHVDLRGQRGIREWTALHWAADEGRIDICQRLLAAAGDPLQEDHAGRTAVDVAKRQGHAEVLRLFHHYVSH